MEPDEGAGGAGLEKDRDGDGAVVFGVEGVVVFGVEGDVVFGVEEKERDGDVDFGAEKLFEGDENDLLPELKLFDAARTGAAKMPSAKTTITTRARMRLTQVQGRMVPHPPG